MAKFTNFTDKYGKKLYTGDHASIDIGNGITRKITIAGVWNGRLTATYAGDGMWLTVNPNAIMKHSKQKVKKQNDNV